MNYRVFCFIVLLASILEFGTSKLAVCIFDHFDHVSNNFCNFKLNKTSPRVSAIKINVKLKRFHTARLHRLTETAIRRTQSMSATRSVGASLSWRSQVMIVGG